MAPQGTKMHCYGFPPMYLITMFIKYPTLVPSQTITLNSQTIKEVAAITFLDDFISQDFLRWSANKIYLVHVAQYINKDIGFLL